MTLLSILLLFSFNDATVAACEQRHVVQAGKPLGDVLRKLAESDGFELRMRVSADAIVTTDARGTAREIVHALLGDDGYLLEAVPLEGCPESSRITRLWVLPKGEAGEIENHTSLPTVAISTAPVPAPTPKTDRGRGGRAGMSEAERLADQESFRHLRNDERKAHRDARKRKRNPLNGEEK